MNVDANRIRRRVGLTLTIVVFGVVFGGRRAELMRCTAADYDKKRGVFRVRGSKTADSKREVPVLSPFRGLVKRGLPGLPIETWNNTYRDLDPRGAFIVHTPQHIWVWQVRRQGGGGHNESAGLPLSWHCPTGSATIT